MINVFRAPDRQGRAAIAVVLSPDAMFVTAGGDPYPGGALPAPQAREIAYRLLRFAQEIENGRPLSFQAAHFSKDNPMTATIHKNARRLAAWMLATAGLYAASPVTEIVLPATRMFPESITSTSDGTLIIGSLGHGNVSRIAPGKTKAEEWIKAGTGGLNQVLGVFADEKGKDAVGVFKQPGE